MIQNEGACVCVFKKICHCHKHKLNFRYYYKACFIIQGSFSLSLSLPDSPSIFLFPNISFVIQSLSLLSPYMFFPP